MSDKLSSARAGSIENVRLFEEFVDPPAGARPRVWWHWMDGNIDEAGIVKDLEWLGASGVGGVQIFTGSMGIPAYTAEPVAFRSPAWQSAMRCATATAERLGLELAIATSAGWSATGGPWVRPAAGMKKLVWSTSTVAATSSGPITLPTPPSTSGPFQDIPFAAVRRAPVDVPEHYQDVAVLAFPLRDGHLPRNPARLTASGPVTGGRGLDALTDGRFWPAAELFADGETSCIDSGTGWFQLEFDQPTTVASVRIGLPAQHGFGASPAPHARLEASDDGESFRSVIDLPASASPVRSATFPAVTASYFRLCLKAQTGSSIPVAPGVKPLQFSPKQAPTPLFEVSGIQLFTGPRISRAEEKAGYAPVPDFYAIDDGSPSEAAAAIQPEEVMDVTEHLRPDGTLDWAPQEGDWTVLRMGYSLTGHLNGPAPVDATGLEVDKLDAGLVTEYFEHYLGFFDEALGKGLVGAKGVTALLSDSIESGPQNWTAAMREEFRARRGYDLLPWLPAVSGVVVGGAQRSDAFLWDFRRTIAELLAEKHYGTIAKIAGARGMRYYAEALEDHRPQLGDDLEMRSHADIPMGAMWCYEPEAGPAPTYVADVQGAASVANVYGKATVGAESMSAFGKPHMFTPRKLKPVADMGFALGVNLVSVHASPHQPEAAPKPGVTLSPYLGQSFTRNETWAHAARPWIDYLARCSHLLRQGNHAADIAYFYGEEAPVTGVFGDSAPEIPSGYGFDFINLDGLLNHVTVTQDGSLLSTGGVSYRLLYLGGSSHRMTLAAVQRLTELLDAGATVAGRPPTGSPSQGDDKQEWAAAVDRLWNQQRHGLLDLSGLPDSEGVIEALARINLSPGWVMGAAKGATMPVIHRRVQEGDLYFVSNQLDRPEKIRASFRGKAASAELWDPVQVSRSAVELRFDTDRTIVDLQLEPFGSTFVFLHHAVAKMPDCMTQLEANAGQETAAEVQLGGRWDVTFDGDSQSIQPLTFDMPRPWSGPGAAHHSREVKYFSGTATYRHTFHRTRAETEQNTCLVLNLGEVSDLAEIRLNGQNLGILWTRPFRIDITNAVREGANELQIAVTNSWWNRLVGDATDGEHGRPGSTILVPDADVLPAGLHGPVRLEFIRSEPHMPSTL